MGNDVYIFTFDEKASWAEVRSALAVSTYAAEGIHGRARVILDASHAFDEEKRACVIDAGTPVGLTIAQIFTALLLRRVGEGAFKVARIFASLTEITPPSGGAQ